VDFRVISASNPLPNMATVIKQVRDEARQLTTLQVGGEMFRDDAVLLVRIASDVRRETADKLILDLADLDLLDSEAAHVLQQAAEREEFIVEGIEIFLQGVIDDAEGRRN
jgi:anti-anti-sigma regulatory factor